MPGSLFLLNKGLWRKCFPVNFVNFLRTPFLQNISGRLLLNDDVCDMEITVTTTLLEKEAKLWCNLSKVICWVGNLLHFGFCIGSVAPFYFCGRCFKVAKVFFYLISVFRSLLVSRWEDCYLKEIITY